MIAFLFSFLPLQLYAPILIAVRQAGLYTGLEGADTMKIEIGSYEAKTKLPDLLRQVNAGKSFTITNRGNAIADLVPSKKIRNRDRAASIERLKALMRDEPLRGVNIKALIEDGRA